MGDLSTVTIVIIAVNVLISMKGFNDYGFFEKFKFHIGSIQRGEQIRMISSGFLHVDGGHLLFNMLTLYFFAPVLVMFLGDLSMAIVYVVSLVFGSLLALGYHKNEYNYSAVGASGAVMGIVYAGIMLAPEMRIYGFVPGWVFGIGYLVYTIVGMKQRSDNIGHTAHFGGAIGGFAVTLFMKPELISGPNNWIIGLMAIPIVAFFVLEKQGFFK